MNKFIKIIIVIVVLGVLAVLGASFFSGESGGSATNTTGLRSANTGETVSPTTGGSISSQDSDTLNREFLAILLNLESISLNDDIFSEPAFSALIDNTVRLNQPGNEGRPNPFAPIGIDTQTTVPLSASASSFSQPVEDFQELGSADAEAVTETPLPDGASASDLSPDQLDEVLSSLGSS